CRVVVVGCGEHTHAVDTDLGGLRSGPRTDAAHDVTVHADPTGGDHLFATPATGHTRSSERLLQPDTARYVGVGVPVGVGSVVVAGVVVGAQGPEPLTGRLRQLGLLLEPARVLGGTAATPARASGPVAVVTAVPPATGPTVVPATVVPTSPEVTALTTALEVTVAAIAPPRTAITAITALTLITTVPHATGPTFLTITEVTTTVGTAAASPVTATSSVIATEIGRASGREPGVAWRR